MYVGVLCCFALFRGVNFETAWHQILSASACLGATHPVICIPVGMQETSQRFAGSDIHLVCDKNYCASVVDIYDILRSEYAMVHS